MKEGKILYSIGFTSINTREIEELLDNYEEQGKKVYIDTICVQKLEIVDEKGREKRVFILDKFGDLKIVEDVDKLCEYLKKILGGDKDDC